MKHFKIACSDKARKYFSTEREIIELYETDFTDVAAVILTEEDASLINVVDETKLGLPVFVITPDGELDDELRKKVRFVLDHNKFNRNHYSREIETAADRYEDEALPPFFKTLQKYVEKGSIEFDTPGHHGGQYFRKHPAGRAFYEFYGENLFRSDISSSDVDLGDLLIHEGPAVEAQKYAAQVYNADKTYFVMNGTSTANAIAISAIMGKDDLVLFDRNNHVSNYNAALSKVGGIPVYLETVRNPFGFIGGIDDHCFNEDYLRAEIAKIDPKRAKEDRPFRLAIIQLGTYDGTIYNAKQVVKRIGHLCDYILFDSAWVGYEQFIPMMRDCSPLLIDLDENDPGILVTQSVHKQQAGFSQASQIHKKDAHVKGQRRYVNHKRFNDSYMIYSSTSPFYPIFASLDINAKMQDGEMGKKMWDDCVKLGIEARKKVIANCTMMKPFVPDMVNGKKWEEYPTEEIASNIEFFKFHPGQKWHSFDGYGEDQYFVDPNKFMLTTPGIDAKTGKYEDFGIPATILASYLGEHGITREKSDLNSILFLLTPSETSTKMNNLVAQIAMFEKLVESDAPLKEVLPKIYAQNIERYKGYTIRRLCQEMHDFYKDNNAKQYQKQLFRRETLPEIAMSAYDAREALVKNDAKLVAVDEILGEIALQGALPYPPGILCVVPGERWTETVQKYFLILQDGINNFPGFAPEIHGVYLEQEGDKVRAYGYVYDDQYTK